MYKLCILCVGQVVTKLAILQIISLSYKALSRLTIVSREAKKKQAVRDEQVIKTHDSESRGQEEAGRTRRTSDQDSR